MPGYPSQRPTSVVITSSSSASWSTLPPQTIGRPCRSPHACFLCAARPRMWNGCTTAWQAIAHRSCIPPAQCARSAGRPLEARHISASAHRARLAWHPGSMAAPAAPANPATIPTTNTIAIVFFIAFIQRLLLVHAPSGVAGVRGPGQSSAARCISTCGRIGHEHSLPRWAEVATFTSSASSQSFRRALKPARRTSPAQG